MLSAFLHFLLFHVRRKKVTMTSASTSLVLVGWDDIKGRPIYSRKPAATSFAPAKKNKAPIKKGILTAARRPADDVNVNVRRNNIPTVQVAVGSLMASSTADDERKGKQIDQQSSHAASKKERRVSKPAARLRQVSFSPTSSKSCNDTKRHHSNSSSSKLAILPNTKFWDKKRKGYGSKKVSQASGYYFSPVIVLEGAENVNGWGDGISTSARKDYDTNSIESEQLDSHEDQKDEVLSLVNDDLSSENNDGVDFSFSPNSSRAIQSVGHYDSNNSSFDKHSGSELKGSNSSFRDGKLDNHDDIVHSPSINQPKTKNESIPEIIHVETDVTVTNDDYDDDDLTAKAEETSVGHLDNHTPSTKTAEETSYKLHSGGTNDFVDYDIPLDEPNATDNTIQRRGGKKRSYGCSEKPVRSVSNRQAKAAAAVTSDNVIGWDEVKCRPIFHAKSKKKVDENRLDKSNDDIGDEFVGDDVNKKSSNKRRAYSSRFRKTSLTKAIEQMSVLTSPKEDDDHTQEESRGDDVNLVNENDEENGSGAESNADLDLEMEEIAFDENARHIQPTESSSLEAARAFFRYLDSNHRLVVDQYDASPRVSSEVIRTTRHIVHSHQLRTEYSEYCDMLAQTGVAPITITEFASNWNRYFVGKGIRDGLLDED